MAKFYCKIICIVKKIQPASRIIRFYGANRRSYRISFYCQIIILFQNIRTVQSTIRRNSYALPCINITDRTMSTDRQSLIRSMLKKLELNFRVPYRINKYANAVFGKSDQRIGFIIFPRKSSPFFILNNRFHSIQFITLFGILYSHKDKTDIYNISVSIFTYIVITHSRTSSLIIRIHSDTFRITFAFPIVRKSLSVQVITPKGFIRGNSGLKFHIKAITIVYRLIIVPGFYGQ